VLLFALACVPPDAPRIRDTGHGSGSCSPPVHLPASGWSTDETPLADRHAETYGADPAPRQIHLDWSYDPARSISVVWRTDAATLASQVELGDGTVAEGRSFELEGMGRIHEVHVCDLEAGTTYRYRVGGAGAWSDTFSFTTAPAAGDTAPFRFVVAGDSRDAPGTWGTILDVAEPLAPDFYVFTGDAVHTGTDVAEWDAWLDAGAGHFESHPLVMSHGNHEALAEAYFALFALPGNEQWYGLDYGGAHLAVLNDTTAQSGAMEDQAAWLADDLAATDAPWRFAFHHMPAYSSCEGHGSDLENRAAWSPVEEAGGVAVDFTGHNHVYERSYPIRDGIKGDRGTLYVVSAGAGAGLYDFGPIRPFTSVHAITNNFVMVEVDGDAMHLTAYDIGGNVLDHVDLTR
jgi:hypothetical protein